VAVGVGGGVGAAAGVGGPICWVAREVYGEADPRWQIFRSWLMTSAPQALRDLYIAHGPAFAAWIHDKPTAKATVRLFMDRAIAAHVAAIRSAAPANEPCRDSE
jgi:hypothetical protein